eukprot:COSAG02_NODE_1400_length_12844_cov_5.256493_11_plen_255_part_00
MPLVCDSMLSGFLQMLVGHPRVSVENGIDARKKRVRAAYATPKCQPTFSLRSPCSSRSPNALRPLWYWSSIWRGLRRSEQDTQGVSNCTYGTDTSMHVQKRTRPASEIEQRKGLFGIGARETLPGDRAGPLGTDQMIDMDTLDDSGDREEQDNRSSELNVTPGRELPGTPDKKTRRRLREKDRSTTDHAIVGSLAEPLFRGSASDALHAGHRSPPVEELELGHPDDDRATRAKECCGPRLRAKSQHLCNGSIDW